MSSFVARLSKLDAAMPVSIVNGIASVTRPDVVTNYRMDAGGFRCSNTNITSEVPMFSMGLRKHEGSAIRIPGCVVIRVTRIVGVSTVCRANIKCPI